MFYLFKDCIESNFDILYVLKYENIIFGILRSFKFLFFYFGKYLWDLKFRLIFLNLYEELF